MIAPIVSVASNPIIACVVALVGIVAVLRLTWAGCSMALAHLGDDEGEQD